MHSILTFQWLVLHDAQHFDFSIIMHQVIILSNGCCGGLTRYMCFLYKSIAQVGRDCQLSKVILQAYLQLWHVLRESTSFMEVPVAFFGRMLHSS